MKGYFWHILKVFFLLLSCQNSHYAQHLQWSCILQVISLSTNQSASLIAANIQDADGSLTLKFPLLISQRTDSTLGTLNYSFNAHYLELSK